MAIKDGLVVQVGPWADLAPASAGAALLGGPERLVMPGLVNGHTHLAMSLFRGLADDLDLMDWLERHIWPAEAAVVSEEMVYWTSLLALAEAIRAGTTSLADGYFCEKGALKAATEAGMRAILAQGIIDLPTSGAPDPQASLKAARDFLEAGQGVSQLIRPALFCHSPYTCSPTTLRGARDLAEEFETQVFIHLAESEAETGIILEKYGQRPTAYLDEAGFLGPRTVAIHCIHLEPAEIELLARRGVAAVTCPESNMKLASGRARVRDWLAAGLKTGLGTDGAASNNDLNLFGEMGSLARWHKAADQDPTALPAGQVLDLATRAGAEALGLEGVGLLRPGAPADLITLDLTEPNLLPWHNLAAQLVYAAHGGEVRDVVVAGRPLLKEGELMTIDLKEVQARVRHLSGTMG
ncbi:MAG: amidohydrolase [Deltaproteobacteria bacterium]|nr:amidohydrolase [Deltaproteobacteria bacterium]